MKIRSFFYIILAGILWGSQTLFVHFLKPFGFTSLELTSVRAIVSFCAIALFALIKGRDAFKIRWKDLLITFGVGICLFATAAFYYIAMDMTSTATSVVIMYLSPVYVMLFSVFFFKEKFSASKLVALVLVIAGSVLVSGAFGGGEGFKFNLVGVVFAVLSGLTLAGYNIFTKISSARKCKPLTTTLYGFMFMALSSLIFVNPIEIVDKATAAPAVTAPLLIGIGLVTCILPYFLYNLAVEKIPVGTAASLAVIDPMAATVFSVFIGEKLNAFSVVGVVLVLCAIVLLGLAEGKKGDKNG